MGKKFLRLIILCLAFTALTALLSVTALAVTPDDTPYRVSDGVIYFNKNTGTLVGGYTSDYKIPPDCAVLENVSITENLVIPREIDGVSVRAIGSNAFSHRSTLRSVVIPEGVTEIGYNAFAFCGNLTSLTLPDSLTRLGDEAFLKTGLTSVVIPKNMENFGHNAFYDCDNLSAVIVSEGLKSLGGASDEDGGVSVFSRCGSLISVILPESLTRIGYGVFSDCNRLSKIAIPDSVTEIEDGAFSYTALEEVIYPKSLESVGANAFTGCKNLSRVTIPAGVKFDEYTFFNSSVYDAYFDDGVTEIPDGMFAACRNLYKVRIPKSVTRIGDSAFANTSLANIVIPDGITEIGEDAFSHCNYLRAVTLPKSVTGFGLFAFGVYRNLPCDVYYQGSKQELHAVSGFDKSLLLYDVYEERPGRKITAYYNQTMPDTDQLSILPELFQDVPEDSYFTIPVEWAAYTGVTGGTSPGVFSPYDTCNMAQVLTFMWRACCEPEADEDLFHGSLKGKYYAEAAKWACEKEIISPEEFNPAAPCTRAMLVKFIWALNYSPTSRIIDHDKAVFVAPFLPFDTPNDNLFHYDVYAASIFSDVPYQSPYANAIGWALDSGVTNGTTDNTFSPDQICTRAQVMSILFRAHGKGLLRDS